MLFDKQHSSTLCTYSEAVIGLHSALSGRLSLSVNFPDIYLWIHNDLGLNAQGTGRWKDDIALPKRRRRGRSGKFVNVINVRGLSYKRYIKNSSRVLWHWRDFPYIFLFILLIRVTEVECKRVENYTRARLSSPPSCLMKSLGNMSTNSYLFPWEPHLARISLLPACYKLHCCIGGAYDGDEIRLEKLLHLHVAFCYGMVAQATNNPFSALAVLPSWIYFRIEYQIPWWVCMNDGRRSEFFPWCERYLARTNRCREL